MADTQPRYILEDESPSSAAPSKSDAGRYVFGDETTSDDALWNPAPIAKKDTEDTGYFQPWMAVPKGTAEKPTPWMDVAEGAAANAIPSALNLGANVASLVAKPVIATGKELYNRGFSGTAEDVYNAAKDVASHPKESAKSLGEGAWNAAKNIGESYKHKYYGDNGFDIENLKHTLATDPAGVVADVAPVYGGLMKGAKALSVMGGVDQAALDAAAVAKVAADPKIDAAIKAATATKNGAGIGAADLPAGAHRVVMDTIAEKGLSPDTMKEALAKWSTDNAPIPRSAITREPPGPVSANASRAAAENGIAAISQKAADLAGDIAPHPYNLATELDTAYVKAANDVNKKYEAVRQLPGQFHPDLANKVMPEVQREVNSLQYIHPSSVKSFPETLGAMDYLKSLFPDGGMPSGRFDMGSLENVRKDLNARLSAAEGSDIFGMRKVIDGYDNALEKMAARPNGYGLPGAPAPANAKLGQTAVTAMRDARGSARDLFNTYRNPADAPQIANAIKKLTPSHSKDASGFITQGADTQAATAAQEALRPSLMHPAQGPKLFKQLDQVTGPSGSAALRDYVKQSILQPNKNPAWNKPFALGDKLLPTLNGPVAKAAMTPEELNAARVLAHSANILKTPSIAGGQLAAGVAQGAADAALPMVAAAFGHVVGGIPTALASAAAEKGAANFFHRRAINKQLSGAPSALPVSQQVGRAVANTAIGAAKLPLRKVPAIAQVVNNAQEQPRPLTIKGPGNRQPHAAGGSVKPKLTHEQLVQRLIRLSEQAKKAGQQVTKPLLNAPDDAITHALKIAEAKAG